MFPSRDPQLINVCTQVTVVGFFFAKKYLEQLPMELMELEVDRLCQK